MHPPPELTGVLADDWKILSDYWLQSSRVFGSEVGPKWEMPGQHRACIAFAEAYPAAKPFLLERLSDASPIVAAYAFKCLIRITDLTRAEVPTAALVRTDMIEFAQHSRIERKTLSAFFEGYFQQYAARADLLQEQESTLAWQENELAAYKRATEADNEQS